MYLQQIQEIKTIIHIHVIPIIQMQAILYETLCTVTIEQWLRKIRYHLNSQQYDGQSHQMKVYGLRMLWLEDQHQPSKETKINSVEIA